MQGQNSDLLTQIVRDSPTATFVIDAHHRVVHWNRACEVLTGTSAAEIVGTTNAWAPFYPRQRPVMADLIVEGRLRELPEVYSGKVRPSPVLEGSWEAEDFFAHFPDGGKWLAFTATAIIDSDGRVIGAIESLRDVTAARKAEAAWSESQHLLHEIIDAVPVPMFVLNADHAILLWNRACEIQSGHRASEMIGTRNQWRVFHPQPQPVLADLVIDNRIDEIQNQYHGIGRNPGMLDQAWETTALFPASDNGPRWLYLTAAPLHGMDGSLVGAVETIQDITAQKNHELQLERQANHDPLTGLANRSLLNSRLDQVISQAQRDDLLLALLYIDLDNFKEINDTLGHDAGDEVIRAIGQRINAVVREVDTVSRIAGDEYVVLLHAPSGIDQVTHIARRLLQQVQAPLAMGRREWRLGCSIGIALYPMDGDSREALMKHADTAMYQAKKLGKGGFRFHAAALHAEARQRRESEAEAGGAALAEQPGLRYQPRFCLRTGRISGAEAVLQGDRPHPGSLPAACPGLLEAPGPMGPLDEWMLRTALAETREWTTGGETDLPLLVRLSSHLGRRRNLAGTLAGILAGVGASPRRLLLGVDETLLADTPDWVRIVLEPLRDNGFALALTGFGAGQTSLATLLRFPWALITIDRSLIAGLGRNAEAGALVRAILQAGHALGRRMLAEGVDTAQQQAYLAAEGCDEAQGAFFSPPLNGPDLLRLTARLT